MPTLDLSNYEIKKGAFADVLVCKKSKRAYKLFKSYNHPDLDGTGKEDEGENQTNLYRTNVFCDELLAYQTLESNQQLKRFTPIFYGSLHITSVTKDGLDMSMNYLLSCCIDIEYVEGTCIKLNDIDQNTLCYLETNLNFKLVNLRTKFEDAGIRYMIDSSVIYNDTEFKIIDFGTKDPSTFELIF